MRRERRVIGSEGVQGGERERERGEKEKRRKWSVRPSSPLPFLFSHLLPFPLIPSLSYLTPLPLFFSLSSPSLPLPNFPFIPSSFFSFLLLSSYSPPSLSSLFPPLTVSTNPFPLHLTFSSFSSLSLPFLSSSLSLLILCLSLFS